MHHDDDDDEGHENFKIKAHLKDAAAISNQCFHFALMLLDCSRLLPHLEISM